MYVHSYLVFTSTDTSASTNNGISKNCYTIQWSRRPYLSLYLITCVVYSCYWGACLSSCSSCRLCLAQIRRRCILTSIFCQEHSRSPFKIIFIILECFVIRDAQHIGTTLICTYSFKTRPKKYRHTIKNIRFL